MFTPGPLFALGQTVQITVAGAVIFGNVAGVPSYALPEGVYAGYPQFHAFAPGSVLPYSSFAVGATAWLQETTTPLCILAYVREAGCPPYLGSQIRPNPLQPQRGATYTPAQLAAVGVTNPNVPYQIYFAFNDGAQAFGDNFGAYDVQVNVTGTPIGVTEMPQASIYPVVYENIGGSNRKVFLPVIPVPGDGGMCQIDSRLLSIHFEDNRPYMGDLNRFIKGAKPTSEEDMIGGDIGARTQVWWPARKLSQSEFGQDLREINGQIDPMGLREPWYM